MKSEVGAPLARGDLLAVFSAGVRFCHGLEPQQPLPPAEVLVDGARVELVRRRKTITQPYANEVDLDEA